MPKFRRALIGLSLVLAACGGSPSSSSPPQPQPQPQPQPPAPPAPGRSSIGGVVESPGGRSGAAALSATGLPDTGKIISRPSWWTDRSEVGRRQAAAGATPQGTIPGQFIVKLRPGPSLQEPSLQESSLQGASAQAGEPAALLSRLNVNGAALTLVRPLGPAGLGLYRAPEGLSGAASAATLSALAARPDVMYAEPDRWMHAMKTPNDSFYPVQWGAQAMNLPAAWDITTGSAVTVAVVDSGSLAHPDLASRLLPGFDFVQDAANGGDGDGADADPTDKGGDSGYHGAHVAGIVAAASNNGKGIAGVSWGAKIVPVRVLGVSGGGSLSDILLGIYWVAGGKLDGVPNNANPARVINLSLGGKGDCSASEQELFDAVAEAGIVTVVAAGNEDSDASTSSPANCKNVIAVGATGPDGKRAYYSNHGARIDLMAPGGNTELLLRVGNEQFPGGILSTVNNDSGKPVYTFYQGTSQAAPQVAGLAALLLSTQPGLSPAQVLARMKAVARPVSNTNCGVASGCGAGLIDAAATLKGAATPTPAPPPVPAPVAQIKTLVAAFYVLPQGFDLDRSPAALVEPKTLSNPYQLKNAEPGKYLVGAWQDIDSDGVVDDGEPLGAYPDFVTVDSVTRTIIGINITLEPYSRAPTTAAATAKGVTAAQTPLQSLAQAIRERAQTR